MARRLTPFGRGGWAWLMVALAPLVLLCHLAWPFPPGFLALERLEALRVTDRQGRLLREVWSSDDGRAVAIRVESLPPHVIHAFLAAEDTRFFHHPGVDPIAIARALRRNLREGKIVEGASTLTQQLARQLVPRPRTVWGKCKEALLALRLEAQLRKPQILEQYLNRVPFGNGAFGIEAASQLYFGRPSHRLSVKQAAALAALVRGPGTYNPYRKAEALGRRVRRVLSRMREEGMIDAETFELASRAPLDLQAPRSVFRAPHAVAHALARLGLETEGRIAGEMRLTLDGVLQAKVESAVRDELSNLVGRGVGNAAVLVVDNATGEVLAYVGSADFFDDAHQGQNDGVRMRRQPGSTLKPFLYAAAFSRGFTAASIVDDLETDFASEKGAYRPENYDRQEHGPVRLRQALASSYNIPAVKLQEHVGTQTFLEVLRRAGFSLPFDAPHYGLGLALGSGDVSLWELAAAYRGLALGGVWTPLKLVRSQTERAGPRVRFTEPDAAALVADVLSDNDARAPAFGLDGPLRFPFSVAVKTGTSKGYSDNWTLGFTHERTVAVWAGNFDGRAMANVSGVTGAAPLFHRVMSLAMQGVPPTPLYPPESLVSASICPSSGMRSGGACPHSMVERFVNGTAPTQTCPGQSAHEAHVGGAEPGGGRPRIDSPLNGAEFRLFADLPMNEQSIPVRIVAPENGAPQAIELWLDGRRHSVLKPPYRLHLPATPGAHRLSIQRPGAAEPLHETRYRVRSVAGR